MRRRKDYLLRRVADTIAVVPLGRAALDFNGMLTVNETGAYLWELLETEQTVESLTDALCARYEVRRDQAAADTEIFLKKLRAADALTEHTPAGG